MGLTTGQSLWIWSVVLTFERQSGRDASGMICLLRSWSLVGTLEAVMAGKPEEGSDSRYCGSSPKPFPWMRARGRSRTGGEKISWANIEATIRRGVPRREEWNGLDNAAYVFWKVEGQGREVPVAVPHVSLTLRERSLAWRGPWIRLRSEPRPDRLSYQKFLDSPFWISHLVPISQMSLVFRMLLHHSSL